MDAISLTDVLVAIYTFITNIPAEAWAGLGSALGISVIIEALKVKFDGFIKRHAFAISTVLTALTSSIMIAGDFISAHPTVFGTNTAAILGVMQLIYRFPFIGIKALHNTFSDAKAYREAQGSTPAPEVVETPKAEPEPTPAPSQPARPVIADTTGDLPGALKESTFQY